MFPVKANLDLKQFANLYYINIVEKCNDTTQLEDIQKNLTQYVTNAYNDYQKQEQKKQPTNYQQAQQKTFEQRNEKVNYKPSKPMTTNLTQQYIEKYKKQGGARYKT